MAIKTSDVVLKSIKFIAGEWRRKTGVKGPKRSYTDPNDLSRHDFDGFGHETIRNMNRMIAEGSTQDGKKLKTDLIKCIKHANKDSPKTKKQTLNSAYNLICGIKKTGGRINITHYSESGFGWMNDSETKILCDVGEILDSYGDFGDEQTL